MIDDRLTKLEAALHADETLIAEAQLEITRYLTKEIESAELVDRLVRLFDGPQQREAQRLASEALAPRPGFQTKVTS
jgi:hypothetical protein